MIADKLSKTARLAVGACVLLGAIVTAACGGGTGLSRVLPPAPNATAVGTPGPAAADISAAQMNALHPADNEPPGSQPVYRMPTGVTAGYGRSAQSVRMAKDLTWSNAPATPPGGAVLIALSPKDGTMYALTGGVISGTPCLVSPAPSPSASPTVLPSPTPFPASSTLPLATVNDHPIYKYSGGAWTVVPGQASSITVDTNGVLYAVSANCGGNVYAYSNSAWTPLGITGMSVAAAANSAAGPALFVIKRTTDSSGNHPVYYSVNPVPNPSWTQAPGSIMQMVGSYDPNGENMPTPPPTLQTATYAFLPGGLYGLRASGRIEYYNLAGAQNNQWMDFQVNPPIMPTQPGAAGIASNIGGFYILGYPTSGSASNGWNVYRYDLTAGQFFSQGTQLVTQIATAGVPQFPAPAATPPFPIYALSGTGPSYPSPVLTPMTGAVATACPSPVAGCSFPMTITIDPGAQTGPPGMTAETTNIYIVGTSAVTGGVVYVTNTAGATAPLPSGGASPIPFLAGGATSCPNGLPTPKPAATAAVSQSIVLPPLTGARVFMSTCALSVTNATGPTPWTNDGSQKTTYDFVEYTSTNGAPFVDTSQVNSMGLDLTIALSGTRGTQISGFKAGALTFIKNELSTQLDPAQVWGPTDAVLLSQYPYRILAPNGVTLPQPSFLDTSLRVVWDTFIGNWIALTSVGGELGATQIVYGQVDKTSENFKFYAFASPPPQNATPDPSASPIAIIPNPFNTSYQASGSWGTATQTMLAQNGPYTMPTQVGSTTFTQVDPLAAGTIGNMISTAFNRGILGGRTIASPLGCPPPPLFPGPATYVNRYAQTIWDAASTGGLGYYGAYNIAYADQCNLSTTLTDVGVQSLGVTIFKN